MMSFHPVKISVSGWAKSHLAPSASLSQGRYTWKHNQVLNVLAVALESKKTYTNTLATQKNHLKTAFVQEGEGQHKYQPRVSSGELEAAWQMLVDVGQQLTVPPEIVIINLITNRTWSCGPSRTLAFI